MDKKFANQKQLIALCAAGFFSATSFQGCSGKTDNANVIDPTILNHISETLEGNNDATAPSPENKKLTPKDLGFDCNKLNSSGKTTVIVNNGCIDGLLDEVLSKDFILFNFISNIFTIK